MRIQSSLSRASDPRLSGPAIKLLEAAQTVFLRDGGEKFSSRRVAKEAKVGLSTVQHFFPTTDVLLISMLEHVDRMHEDIYRSMGAKLPFSAEARLQAVLDFLIGDLFEPRTRRFYFGFWSLSCHNARAEAFLAKSYENHRDALAVYIGAARPGLTEKQCRNTATHIAALIEGLLVYVVADRASKSKKEYLRSVKQTISMLLDFPRDADTKEVQAKAFRRRGGKPLG